MFMHQIEEKKMLWYRNEWYSPRISDRKAALKQD